MKYSFFKSLNLFLLFFVTIVSFGQSTNTVNYKVTYDVATQVYTAWVIPNYSVPNAINALSTEKGATAQFTLIVPKTFIISNITDVYGVWDKVPTKLGPGQAGQDWSAYPAIDLNANYYVIGKSPNETDYGTFTQGQAVALFTFKGNGCFGPVLSISTNSPFVFAAEDNYSLGVANSFYSRSGQPAGGNQNPLEQFNEVSGGPASCDNTPVIVANPDTQTITNATPVVTSVLTNDKINGNPISINDVNVTIQQQPTNGTLTVNADGTIKYTPTGTFSGTDCYVYKICDKMLSTACDTSKVCITVQAPVVTAPIIVANPDAPTTPNATPTITNVLTNDRINGSPIANTNDVAITIQQQPTNGMLTVNADGTIKYTPNGTFSGTDCYVYKVCDKIYTAACDTAKVCVTVQAPTFPIVLANPDTQTTPNGSSTITNVLANDKINGNPVFSGDVNVSISKQPINGTVIVNTDGTIKYTPNGTFSGTDCYEYKLCSKIADAPCDTAKVCVTVQAPTSTSTDLQITKKVNKKSAEINDVLTYTIVVKNLGSVNATNIVVKDSLGAGLSFISASANKGTFSNPSWSIPSIVAGDSAILTLSAKVLIEGISFNYAKLISLAETDLQKQNNIASECISVPIKVCTGDKIELSAPANYTNATWYKNGVFEANGNTLLVGTSGSYTVTASNSSCPATGCCPIVVLVADCCVPSCIPFSIKRIQK